MKNNNKVIGFLIIFLLFSMSITYADDAFIDFDLNAVVDFFLPNEISYGDVYGDSYGGFAPVVNNLFEIKTTPNGAKINITLINSSGLATYRITTPVGAHKILEPNNTLIDYNLTSIGNYTFTITPQKIGLMNGVVKISYDDASINLTRY